MQASFNDLQRPTWSRPRIRQRPPLRECTPDYPTRLQCPDADVHFLVGGTQTNKTVIASILRPYQGVICVETGHIAVHETGAIESTGHKVITVPGINGKITPQLIGGVSPPFRRQRVGALRAARNGLHLAIDRSRYGLPSQRT